MAALLIGSIDRKHVDTTREMRTETALARVPPATEPSLMARSGTLSAGTDGALAAAGSLSKRKSWGSVARLCLP